MKNLFSFILTKKTYLLLVIFILLPFLLPAAQPPWGTGLSRGQDLNIKLVTFGIGNDIPSYWGHTALIVEDEYYHQAKIYNYGLFSFGDGMLVNFLMGRLIFSGGAFSVPAYLRYYRNLNREIRIATLNLPPDKKLELAARLASSVLPENRDYLYHHYKDNCSTRLRDYLDDATDGQLYRATDSTGRMDLRDHTIRHIARNPFLEIGLMFLMNDEIDQPIRQWDEMFLPDELEQSVLKLEYADSAGVPQKLVSDYNIYFKPERDPVPAKVPAHSILFFMAGIILGSIGLVLGRFSRRNPYGWFGTFYGGYQALLGLVFGIAGLILFLMSSFTDHTVTYFNENLFFAHPLYLIIVYFGTSFASGNVKAAKWMEHFWTGQMLITVIVLALKFLPGFDQNNEIVLAFLFPIIFGSFISAFLLKKNIHASNA